MSDNLLLVEGDKVIFKGFSKDRLVGTVTMKKDNHDGNYTLTFDMNEEDLSKAFLDYFDEQQEAKS